MTRAFACLVCGILLGASAPAIDLVDLSGDAARQTVVAAGTPTLYNGHPSTILLPDGKTMFCFWPVNHGGYGGPAARSDDGGRTWTRIDELMPPEIGYDLECPMAHRLVDADGRARLWVWFGFRASTEQEARSPAGSAARSAAARTTAAMPSVMSEDEGRTWKACPPLGGKFRCILSFQGIVRLRDGSYLGVYHRGPEDCVDRGPLEVLSSTTSDGGQTWSEPRVIAAVPGLDLCEPWVFRSPDGKELAVLMRENTRKGRSKVIFSQDEGRTWSSPADVPDGLTGDRHQGVVLRDGRLVVCFRDIGKGSPTWGHYVAWIGPYDALHGRGTSKPYKVKLLHSYANGDCGYSGVHLLPDGTVVCTAYVKYRNDNCRQSVITTRFKVSETDALRSWKSAVSATEYVPNAMCAHAEPVDLPELLKAADGSRITTVAAWEKRRGELLDYFTRNVYGVRPVERPSDLRFEPIGADVEFPDIPAVRKRARISFSGPRGAWSFAACAFLPKDASPERPVPAFLLICNRDLAKFADIDRKVKSGFFPVEEIVRRGYAAVVFKNTELALDEYRPTWGADGTAVILDPDFRKGFYACWAEARTETSWGAISAWAWGASRVLDWLETLPAVDAKRVAVIGHSRGGKTSLWAAASDSRFAMACVNDSGCCGAKLNHVAVPLSETIQEDNDYNPHWFARSYRQFNGRDHVLPYDQHWIAALVAPRPLYIGSASLDPGAGPWGEFLTARHASPAWELYGKRGLVEDHPYRIGDAFPVGCVGYHLREGHHDLDYFDWAHYMDFADRHLRPQSELTAK